ncbi:MAG: glycosyltransferase family 4 protein [Nannocystaceae bacterium]|nr:glycosyltransferase family 4 protein [Nannocystaceae bacterium]
MIHRFVVPPLDGPTTGGTRFNAELIAALRRRGEAVQTSTSYRDTPSLSWVDSLYLPEFPAWAARGSVGLLTHYLPSLLTHGARPPSESLQPFERESLACARAFMTPSVYLADELTALGVDPNKIGVVEPGVSPSARPAVRGIHGEVDHEAPLQAVLVANVTPGKGILELLDALVSLRGRYVLRIIGSLEMDQPYVRRCHAVTAARDGQVVFEGALPHAQCLTRVRESDLLVSASRMESYGMALAEARACGVPIVACEGGNVANLVMRSAGGCLTPDPQALAMALVALAEDRETLDARTTLARAMLHVRTWDQAAEDFLVVTPRL